ncbi:unnamed protein product [Echinostoma caproni]|uniref:RT_RNaseH domain-containing protein n=1 Tax=Echinostoma caproni TaxID=27848 RepID=A0A183A7S0_9TREM|nr:unnamed protein product [Echinostoma caproni]
MVADDSNSEFGAVISLEFPDELQKAVSNAARSSGAMEQNYSQIEKETLSIVFTVEEFHKMLYGRKLTLLINHKPLIAIFGSKKDIPVCIANRLQRWALIILSYDFETRCQSTTSFGQADALSKLIKSPRPESKDRVIDTPVD